VLAYLDHAAGGPLHPSAAEAMAPWLDGAFGNPSGAHRVARSARAALEEARDSLAAILGVEPGGVIFVSGGTESDNLAVLGCVAARPGPVVVSAIEHPAVLEAARASGQEVRVAPVGADGAVDLEGLKRLIDDDVSLVSVQLANHEVGTIQPLGELATLVSRRAPHALLHTDAVQAAPWIDLATAASCADLITVSAHKWGGPQGIGALAARGEARRRLRPIIHGGGQEGELRSGTQNTAGAVGMAAAAMAYAAVRESTTERVRALRDHLASRLLASVPGCVETAASFPRLPGHLHMRFAGVESEALLVLLDDEGVCASAGSACASGALEPSPVLLAMGVPKAQARTALRLSLGPTTTREEVEHAAAVIERAVSRLLAP
jgi:cysteine desulfurase